MSIIRICDVCTQVAKPEDSVAVSIDSSRTTGFSYHIHYRCVPEELRHLSFYQDKR